MKACEMKRLLAGEGGEHGVSYARARSGVLVEAEEPADMLSLVMLDEA
jgi:hypothetical protein